MEMDMEMMMHYHHELYKLQMCLSNQHHQMAETQMQIAKLNYEMYMHMMNHMPTQENNYGMNQSR